MTPQLIRPEITCSVAVSLDGRIDGRCSQPLRLSSAVDFAAVDELRASQDAILVGAGTLRRDNPRLIIKEDLHRQRRLQKGQRPDPIKVTLTCSGNLAPELDFFRAGEAGRIVYCPALISDQLGAKLQPWAEVISCPGSQVDPEFLLRDLYRLGIHSLLVEGGQHVHSLFIEAGLVDRLRVAIAPFFIGDKGAPGFVNDGCFPFSSKQPLRLESVENLGGTAVLWYRAA